MKQKCRRIGTQSNLKKVTSALSKTQRPRRTPIHTREQRQPPMPEQTPRPKRLIHLHEFVKFRIFTNLNKRWKRAIPKKMTIMIITTTKPTRNTTISDLLPAKKPFHTPPTRTPRSSALSLSRTWSELRSCRVPETSKKGPHENPS